MILQLFNEEEIKKIVEIDIEYGYNFQQKEMNDCFEALNALPRRERRRLIHRIKVRKSLVSIESDNSAVNQALKVKYGANRDINAPSADLAPFEMDDLLDNEILHYLIFNYQSSQSDLKSMEAIVREFCKPLPENHPTRVEKILNVMRYKEALKLYLILPRGCLSSQDLSSRSKLRPYILDFIDDAIDKLNMPKEDIMDCLLRFGETLSKANEALLEESLVSEVERGL